MNATDPSVRAGAGAPTSLFGITPLVWRAVERELLVWLRMWRSVSFSAVVEPLLFLAAMGVGLGGLVDESSGTVDGVRYIEFVTPGLLVAAAMLSMSQTALWGVMAGFKWMGQFNSMVATAMSPADVYAGLVVAGAVRAGASAVAFLVVAAALGGVVSWWAPLAVVVAALLAAGTTASLAAFSVTRESDQAFALIMRLGVVPLFLFSGTFFPVDQLPAVLQPLAWLSPLWHAAEVARMATTGVFRVVGVAHVAVLVGILVVSVPIGARNFTRRLTP